MLTYKASYKFADEAVLAGVVDFPGTVTFGNNVEEARRALASALVDMAETNLFLGEPHPIPDPSRTDPDADIEGPIHLLLTAATRIAYIPQEQAS